MACKNVCQLCPHMVVSRNIVFASGVLTINIPEGSYGRGKKYCIFLTQSLPNATTIKAPVIITIGNGTVAYPLIKRNGIQVVAKELDTRKPYAVIVETNATGGSFRLLRNLCCASDNALNSINGTAPVAAPAGGGTA